MVARILPKQPRRTFLKEWRDFRGLTQEVLAEKVGTGKDQISRWEGGQRGMTAAVQQALADALDIEPHDLFRDPHISSIDALLRDATDGDRQLAADLVRALMSRRRRGDNSG